MICEQNMTLYMKGH